MNENVGILAPGKGWGNFVSYISCFRTISNIRNKKVILITKEFSSAKSYLNDQNFVKKFYEIPNESRGLFKKILYMINLYKILSDANLKEIFIFHSSATLILICYLANIRKIYAPGIKYQNFLLKKKNKLYEKFNSIKYDSVEETKKLTKKILEIDKVDFIPLKYRSNIDEKLIGICIACSGPEKQWGTNNYTKLIEFFIKNNYNKFLLLSGKNQSNYENIIINNFTNKTNFITTSNKTIAEVIPDLKKCYFVVGNDTGFSHLSVAYNKKTYVILGDCPEHTYSDLIVSIDKDKKITRSSKSIKTITIEKVIEIIKR
tara:strand:- start:924 stop:1874 length:951 start_codon:yes stop_codon:yes gene_type:complete